MYMLSWSTVGLLAAVWAVMPHPSSLVDAFESTRFINLKINLHRPTTVPTHTNDALLQELQETNRRQALEIAKLQTHARLLSAPSHGAHGAHGATAPTESVTNYLETPFYAIATQRVGWLGLFMMSLSATAVIMSGFEQTLAQHVELAFFVPFLVGHGGNTGGQAVGTVLSALSSGAVTVRDAPTVIYKEALSGCTMGVALGLIVAPVAYYGLGISLPVAVVMACTLPLVSTLAATLGSSIPLVCVACGLPPSVIAAPAMTSLVDVAGLWTYFVLANRIFEWFGLDLN